MTKSLHGLKVASPLSVSATPTNLGVPNTEESTKNGMYIYTHVYVHVYMYMYMGICI